MNEIDSVCQTLKFRGINLFAHVLRSNQNQTQPPIPSLKLSEHLSEIGFLRNRLREKVMFIWKVDWGVLLADTLVRK